MRTDVMEQLTSRTLAPIYALNKIPTNVPQSWIDAAKLGGPEGVRSFLDNPGNTALRETLPLMTSHIHDHGEDLFIAEFTRPDLENPTPEPVLVYAFLTHDEKEPYLMAQVGPLPWTQPFPDGYPEDLKRLATVHAGFFDDWTFGGPAPVDVFKPLSDVPGGMYERAAKAESSEQFFFEESNSIEIAKNERPDLHDLCVVWRLGDRKWVRFLAVDRTNQQAWFMIPTQGVTRERESASRFIDSGVHQNFVKFLNSK